jgi:hypothetical protein
MSKDNVVEWREHEVHGEVMDEDVSHLDIFAPSQPFEMHSFHYTNLPPLVLRGHGIYPHATGLALWKGAELLAEYLVKYPLLVKEKHVLELGAGMGLVGIISHYLGAREVLLTDGDSQVLENLQYNVNQLQGITTISCRQLIWGKNMNLPKQDCVLAGDCIYMLPSVEPFWETVASLLTDVGVLIYVNECSSQAPFEQVVQVANRHGFVVETDDAPVYIFRRCITT